LGDDLPDCGSRLCVELGALGLSAPFIDPLN
jgi:hypothetical protein